MKSTTKRSRRKTQREAARERRQRDPESDGEEEDTEIVFRTMGPTTDPPSPTPLSPPDFPNTSAELQYEVVLDMVQKINSELGLINMDNDKIRSVCEQLLKDNKERDRVIGLVKKGLDRPVLYHPQQDAFAPYPIIRQDLIDSEANLRATDIGITWEGSDAFFHGVKVVGLNAAGLPMRPRPSTSPPYQSVREHFECSMSTPRQPLMQPMCLGTPDTPLRCNSQEGTRATDRRHRYSGSTTSR